MFGNAASPLPLMEEISLGFYLHFTALSSTHTEELELDAAMLNAPYLLPWFPGPSPCTAVVINSSPLISQEDVSGSPSRSASLPSLVTTGDWELRYNKEGACIVWQGWGRSESRNCP